MSTHVSAQLLSAYLDRQLDEPEARQLEDHLDRCPDCHVRLAGLRQVVSNLKRLQQLAPPSTLEQTVARRIALVGERASLLDRLDQGMSLFTRQSPLLATFGVVIALALFIYLFSYNLHLREHATTPVIFEDPPATVAVPVDSAERGLLEIAGRRLRSSAGGPWVEEGVDAEAVSRTLELDSATGRAFLAQHPELAELAALDRSVVLEVDGEVVGLN